MSEKICYKCIHFSSWEGNTWCIEEDDLTWNNAPVCKEYKEKK